MKRNHHVFQVTMYIAYLTWGEACHPILQPISRNPFNEVAAVGRIRTKIPALFNVQGMESGIMSH